MADELSRKGKLVESGAVSQAEVARLALRLNAMDAGTAAATAERDMKALILERTQVRAPSDGVVMTRLASPGMTAGSMQDGKPLLELYDPTQMQVRADVPLADAGLVAIGQPAEIQVDVLPDRVFRGTVVRMVHLADIAKNTVQAKVLIVDPAPELKPEMLARVRLFPQGGQRTAGATGATGATGNAPPSSRLQLWAPAQGVQRSTAQSTQASALVVMDLHDGRGVAELRTLTLTGTELDGWLEVSSGLRAGDLLVDTRGPQPRAGERVQVVPAPSTAPSTTSGDPHANH
jgi:multidrug efflux pump subunit AcrA (membrane-fusion protein)